MGVLDWRGPEFLILYALLLAAATIVATILHEARPPNDAPDAFSTRLEPLEIAYLAGGPMQALDAAVASLRYRAPPASRQRAEDQAAIDEQRLKDAPPIERALYDLAGQHKRPDSAVVRDAEVILEPVRSRLTWLELLVPRQHVQRVRRVQALLFTALLGLGVAKIAVGLSRGRPIGFLLVACVVTLILLIYFLTRPPVRSRRGDRVVEQLKDKNVALMWVAGHQPHRLATADVALAVALFGGEALGGTVTAIGLPSHLRAARRESAGGGHSCSSCGGSGCGGGGGGGCGGCGS